MPMPTLNIMQTHERVENSGCSSSWPSLMRPKRLKARNSEKARKKAVEITKLHPKTRMIQFRVALATTARLSGPRTPHITKPPATAMAGQKTPMLIPLSGFVCIYDLLRSLLQDSLRRPALGMRRGRQALAQNGGPHDPVVDKAARVSRSQIMALFRYGFCSVAANNSLAWASILRWVRCDMRPAAKSTQPT